MNVFGKVKIKPGISEKTFECRRGNLFVRGTEYRPEGNDLPIAIVCHGFMAWQDSVKHYAVLLAEMGYASYCFDFCGGSVMKSKSDGKTTDMSVLTEVEDLEAVIEYVSDLPYVDKNRIFLMGCSQGSFVSALTAAKNKYPIEKLCLFYPALCIPDDARAGKMMMSKFDPENIPEILHCGPMKLGRRYAADVMNIDPFDEIGKFSGEVCIVHGTADKIVSLDYSERAAEVYKENLPEGMNENERICFHIIEGGGHMFSKKHDVIATEKLKEFANIAD